MSTKGVFHGAKNPLFTEFGLYRYDSKGGLKKHSKCCKRGTMVAVTTFLILFFVAYIVIIHLTKTNRIITRAESMDGDLSETQKLVFLPPRMSSAGRRIDLHQPRPFKPPQRSKKPPENHRALSNMAGPMTLIGSYRRPKERPSSNSTKELIMDEPLSPHYINQFILDRHDEHSRKMYQKRMATNKPFHLMLDVYPLTTPAPKYSNRFSPYAAKFNSMNSLHQEKAYTTYLNTMKFPQIQPMNPFDPHIDDPVYREKFLKPLEDSPSQLIVHLNLYPKKKKKQRKHEDNSSYFRRSDKSYRHRPKFNFPYHFELPPFKPLRRDRLSGRIYSF